MYKFFLEHEFNDIRVVDSPVYGITFEESGLLTNNMIINFGYIYEDGFFRVDGEHSIKSIPSKIIFFNVSSLNFSLIMEHREDTMPLAIISDPAIGVINDILWDEIKDVDNKNKIKNYSWRFLFYNKEAKLSFDSSGFAIDIPDGYYNRQF